MDLAVVPILHNYLEENLHVTILAELTIFQYQFSSPSPNIKMYNWAAPASG